MVRQSGILVLSRFRGRRDSPQIEAEDIEALRAESNERSDVLRVVRVGDLNSIAVDWGPISWPVVDMKRDW